eukprot:4358394-Amphidinium_carterae.1
METPPSIPTSRPKPAAEAKQPASKLVRAGVILRCDHTVELGQARRFPLKLLVVLFHLINLAYAPARNRSHLHDLLYA